MHSKTFIANRVGREAIKRFCVEVEISFLFSNTVVVTLRGKQDHELNQHDIREFLKSNPEIIKLEVDTPRISQFYYYDSTKLDDDIKKISHEKVDLPRGTTKESAHDNLLETLYFKPDQRCFRD